MLKKHKNNLKIIMYIMLLNKNSQPSFTIQSQIKMFVCSFKIIIRHSFAHITCCIAHKSEKLIKNIKIHKFLFKKITVFILLTVFQFVHCSNAIH